MLIGDLLSFSSIESNCITVIGCQMEQETFVATRHILCLASPAIGFSTSKKDVVNMHIFGSDIVAS